MFIKILIIILVILLILIILQKKNEIYKINNYVNINNICILLTTCTKSLKGYGNENDRILMYNTVINNYLNNSFINIYITNSSGYNFPEFQNNPRVFIFTYIQHNNHSGKYYSSYYEANSILKAFDYFKLNSFKYIVKITGRYFIPDITFKLLIPDNTDLIASPNEKN